MQSDPEPSSERAGGALLSERGAAPTGSRRPLVLLVSVVVVAALSWSVWPRVTRWTAERRARAALSAGADCMSSAASAQELRSRAIRADIAATDWPERCSAPLAELLVSVRAVRSVLPQCEGACCVGDATCVAVDRMAGAVAEVKAAASAGRVAEAPLGVMVAAAKTLGWPHGEREQVTPPLRQLELTEIPLLSSESLFRSALCRMSGTSTVPPWWLLLHHDERGATLCSLSLAAPDLSARCQPVPSVAAGRALYLVDGGLAPVPRLFASTRDAWALYGPTGERLEGLPSDTVGVSTLPTGEAVALVPVNADPNTAAHEYAVVVGGERRFAVTATSPPLLFGGYVLAQRGREAAVYSVDDGERNALGVFPSNARATMRGCTAKSVFAVRMRDDIDKTDMVAIKQRGQWKLVALPADVPPFSLSCHGEEAHFTWVEAGAMSPHRGGIAGTHVVTDLSCSHGGCTRRTGEVHIGRAGPRSRYFVASLGEEVALLWQSALGDMRLRIGAPEVLAKRASVSVMDDAAHRGVAWGDVGASLLSAERAAVLLIPGEDGVRGLVVDRSGAHPLSSPR